MRRIVFFCASLALGMTAVGRSLSPSEALSRAYGMSASRSSGAVEAPVMTVGSKDAPTLYVFNQPDGGWMIVAADDVAAPVIGYSNDGSFSTDNLPDNFKDWLDMCGQQISYASAAGAEPYSVSRSSDWAPIAPMLKTKWDQNTPYNRYCPKSGGFLTPTGCVATAMAQVMKYYNWPETAGDNASFSYEWRGGEVPTLSADFSNYKFDWDNMLDSYFSYTDAQADAVAKLMQACGYSVEMGYSKSGSGAFNEAVGYALAKYFKYDQGLHNEIRDLYTSAEWDKIIYEDLRDFGPIVYWGTGSVGHCFVCDGYQGNGYFHFNWGWSGAYDGYFLLDALNPSGFGTGGGTGGYNGMQGALLGVKPAGAQQSERIYTFHTSGITSAKVQGTWLTMDGVFKNRSPHYVDGYACYMIYSEDGSQFITSVKLSTPSAFTNFGHALSQNMLGGSISSDALGEGTYRVYPGINVDGTDYIFKASKSEPGYVIYTRTKNGSQYVNTATLPATGDCVIEDLSTNGDFYQYSRLKISGNAKFTGEAEKMLNVMCALVDNNGELLYTTPDAVTLKFSPEGHRFEFVSYWFSDRYSTITPGEYTFALCYYDDNESKYKVMASTPVTIRNSETADYDLNGFTVDNAEGVDPSAVRLSFNVDGKAGVTDDTFYFEIRRAGSTERLLSKDVSFYVSAGHSVTASQTITLPDALPGEEYEAYVYKERYQYPDGIVPVYVLGAVKFTIGNTSGIADIESDEDIPAEYFNLQGVRVNASELVPGIYVCRKGTKVTKILVR